MKRFILAFTLCVIALDANAVRVDFIAERGADVATGYFEWESTDPVSYSIFDEFGNGKIIWEISGAIGLSGNAVMPMIDVRLEVMDNWFIDAPVPNTLIGDQITLFGTAAAGSGLFSVQNFYFRDESGLLFDSITQPTQQSDFDQFTDNRADLFPLPSVETFTLTQWQVVAVPIPATVWLFGSALGLLGWIRRKVL